MNASRNAITGLSLVELMVAMVIGLLILAAMLTAYNAGSSASNTTARFSEVQTNGRYAIDFLRREIQHAGFGGRTRPIVSCPQNCPPDLTSHLQKDGGTCSQVICGIAGFAAKLEEPVWGSNDAKALSCIADADYLGGDVLVLRRAGLAQETPLPNKLYVQTGFLQSTVFPGPTATSVVPAPVETYPVSVDVYYVSPYTTTAGDGVPALKRMTLGVGPAMSSQLVASGVENMQVQYGVQVGTTVEFRNASAVNACDWPNVVAVRVWLLVRSSDPEYSGFANTSSYDMGDHTAAASSAVAVNDHYVREVFPLVVNIRH